MVDGCHWWRGDRRSILAERVIRAACPRCTAAPLEEEPYAYLLGQYLGDGNIIRTQRTCGLSITCCDAWPGVRHEVQAAVAAVLPTSSVSLGQCTGCTDVRSHSLHWECLFPQHGAETETHAPDRARRLAAADRERTSGPFLRGLVHSDGCRITNWTQRLVAGQLKCYEYPRYIFCNKSTDILDLCCASLDRLGIAHRRPRWDHVSLARGEAVAALDRWVGPKT